MPTGTFSAFDPRFRGQLKNAPWTLCIGAGVSVGLLPTWLELSQRILERSCNVTFAPGEFENFVQDRGWTFDAWIQAAMNAYLSAGKTARDFTELMEDVLYSTLRDNARKAGVETELFLAFNNPQLLDQREFAAVVAFLAAAPASVVGIAQVLLEAEARKALPAAVITFNYDTLLETTVRLLQIEKHWTLGGVKTHPPTFLKRVTGPAVPLGAKVPVYYLHGCLTPPPLKHRGKVLHDSKEAVVGAETTYLRVASSPFAWPQTTFLHHAENTNLLIVGQSLSDSNIRRWLSWATEIRDVETTRRAGAAHHNMPHVWVTTRPKTSSESEVLKHALTHLGVRIAWLSDWNEVEAALKFLLAIDPPRRGRGLTLV
jgi:hypothetical protein